MAEKVATVLTLIMVKELLAAELKPLVDRIAALENKPDVTGMQMTPDQTRDVMLGVVDPLIERLQKLEEGQVLIGGFTADELAPSQPSVNPAWLTGLTYQGAKVEEKIVDGRPRLVGTPFERPLTPEDVMGFRVYDDNVTVVGKDGRKHVVEI